VLLAILGRDLDGLREAQDHVGDGYDVSLAATSAAGGFPPAARWSGGDHLDTSILNRRARKDL
jgi:hypothetical protein